MFFFFFLPFPTSASLVCIAFRLQMATKASSSPVARRPRFLLPVPEFIFTLESQSSRFSPSRREGERTRAREAATTANPTKISRGDFRNGSSKRGSDPRAWNSLDRHTHESGCSRARARIQTDRLTSGTPWLRGAFANAGTTRALIWTTRDVRRRESPARLARRINAQS